MSPVRNFMISFEFRLELAIIFIGETKEIIIRFLRG